MLTHAKCLEAARSHACRYDVKYGSSGFNPFGWKAGCAFATGTPAEMRNSPEAAMFVCGADDFLSETMTQNADGTLHLAPSISGYPMLPRCTYDNSATALCDTQDGEFMRARVVRSTSSAWTVYFCCRSGLPGGAVLFRL